MNPVAFRSPFSGTAPAKSAWKKVADKAKTHLRFLRREKRDFWIWVPVYLPSFGRQGERLNRLLVGTQLQLLKIFFRIRLNRTVVWYAPGGSAIHLLRLNSRLKVYEAHDLLSDFRTESVELKTSLRQKETMLCERADLIFAASEGIRNKLLKMAPSKQVYLLHHGVDYDHFSADGQVHVDLLKIRQMGRPVAGYFGSLSDANDKEALLALADNGFSVVLIGKALGDYTALEAHPNVFFTGPVDYRILPEYARGFDVGLLNWRPGEWIENCFPVKALEYLASGLPVVSCPIPVLQQHYADVIAFARSPAEFLSQCRKAIEENSDVLRQIRRERVRDCSWDHRYRFVKDLMNECRVLPD
jgi:glycosyltransferase involved in cell wall biosynthesis